MNYDVLDPEKKSLSKPSTSDIQVLSDIYTSQNQKGKGCQKETLFVSFLFVFFRLNRPDQVIHQNQTKDRKKCTISRVTRPKTVTSGWQAICHQRKDKFRPI